MVLISSVRRGWGGGVAGIQSLLNFDKEWLTLLFYNPCPLQIKTQQKYMWSKRESTEEGSPLIDVVEQVRQ